MSTPTSWENTVSETDAPSGLEPAIIVIFGITGDLSQRYLLPSLYHLMKDGLLHEQTQILGVTRSDLTADALLEQVELCVNEIDQVCDPAALAAMHERTSMFQMDLHNPDDYRALRQKLDEIEAGIGICMNRLYYLSIPPQVYEPVIQLLGQAELNASCQHGQAMTRLLVEKPFGYDTTSARELIEATAKVFAEEQVFRIDHYLAKETVQNILTFRLQNPIFEALWSREHIASIHITAYEKIGIEGRVAFYDSIGALRDFIQSHLMQILAIVTMDQPVAMDSEQIHQQKQALMDLIQSIPADQVHDRTVRGQYDKYRDEVKNPRSITETYASITVYIDSERWREVPITLATGKALAERKSEVRIRFHGSQPDTFNELCFRIQPREGIQLSLQTKQPGFDQTAQTTVMDFSYQHETASPHPDAYERVLVDAVRGDHTLFATSGEVMASWRVIQPVLDEWAKNGNDLKQYPSGTEEFNQ